MASRKRPTASSPEHNATLEAAVADLTGEVRALSQHVEVLGIAVDDLRQEVEWALRQYRKNDWVPTQPLTGVSRDPIAEDFAINRTHRSNLPPERVDTPTTTAPPLALLPQTETGFGELF